MRAGEVNFAKDVWDEKSKDSLQGRTGYRSIHKG